MSYFCICFQLLFVFLTSIAQQQFLYVTMNYKQQIYVLCDEMSSLEQLVKFVYLGFLYRENCGCSFNLYIVISKKFIELNAHCSNVTMIYVYRLFLRPINSSNSVSAPKQLTKTSSTYLYPAFIWLLLTENFVFQTVHRS